MEGTPTVDEEQEVEHPAAPAPARPRLRAVLALVPLVLLGALAGGVALVVQPGVVGDVGPGTVELEPTLTGGELVVDLPPLGRVRADSHRGPVGVEVHVRRVDLEAVGEVARDLAGSVVDRDTDAGEVLRAEVAEDLSPMVRRLALQSAIAAVVAGVLCWAVLPRRRRLALVATTGGSLAFVLVAGGVATATFDPAALDQPAFEGGLAAAPDVLATVQRHVDGVDAVESRLEALADRVVDLYSSVDGADEADPRADDTVVLLHVSDLHSNPVGIELVEETARRFAVDAVIDTGDVTSFGADVERAVAVRIGRIDTPYLLVPGNHDAPALRDALAGAGVRVLDGEVVEVAGVRILGVADPTFTADNVATLAQRERALARAARRTAALVERHDPDLLAVHNPSQLDGVHGLVDVALAGHRHRAELEYDRGTAVVSAGSAGATGVGALMTDDDLPYEMQLLQIRRGRLVAVDRIAFAGTDGAFRLERVLVDPDRVDGYPDRGPDRADLLAPLRPS